MPHKKINACKAISIDDVSLYIIKDFGEKKT